MATTQGMPPKPHIVIEHSFSSHKKWRCFTWEVSFMGNRYCREGKAYSLKEAYFKWLRAGRGESHHV